MNLNQKKKKKKKKKRTKTTVNESKQSYSYVLINDLKCIISCACTLSSATLHIIYTKLISGCIISHKVYRFH